MSAVRRVLLTTDTVGGVWDFTRVLAGELRERGVRVALLALGAPSAEQGAQAAACAHSATFAPLRLEWMEGGLADVEQVRALVRDVVRREEADVVHAGQFAAVVPEIPTILTVHSDVVSWHRWTRGADDAELARLRAGPYAALVRRALREATGVAAVSRAAARDVRVSYGMTRALTVVHNGWPLPTGTAAGSARPRRTLLAGRVWDQAKGIDLAARAAGSFSSGEVAVVGEPRHPDHGGAPPVPPPLRMLGRLERAALDAELRGGRVFCAPARYEPFGLVPLQAALSGCALLLSDIPSFRELWDGAAAFFPRGDADALGRAWSELLDDEARCAELARAARARAITRYASRRMAKEYLALYDRCMPARAHTAVGRTAEVAWR